MSLEAILKKPLLTGAAVFGALELADYIQNFNLEDLSLLAGFTTFETISLARDLREKSIRRIPKRKKKTHPYERILDRPSFSILIGALTGLLESPTKAAYLGLTTALGLDLLRVIRITGTNTTRDLPRLMKLQIRRIKEVNFDKDLKLVLGTTQEIMALNITRGAYARERKIREMVYKELKRREVIEWLDGTFIAMDDACKEAGTTLERVLGHRMEHFTIAAISDKIERTERLRAWAEKVLEDPFEKPHVVKGSKNEVIIYKDGGLEALVIKTSDNKEDIEAEYETAEILDDISQEVICRGKWDLRFTVCSPIAVLEKDGKYVYVREHSICKTLAETDNPEILETFKRVARVTAAIHRLFPRERIRGTERSLRATLEARLSPELQISVLPYIKPVEEAIERTELGYSRDGHQWNYGVYQNGDIIIFDTENQMPRRIVYDWANLLDHTRRLSRKEKDQVLDEIFKTHKELGVALPREDYLLGYYNAVCARTLELAAILSERKDTSRVNDMITNSLEALERIEQEFPEYFSRYKGEYQKLRRGFSSLMINSNGTSQELSYPN